MAFNDLALDQWRSLDLAAAQRAAQEAADQVGGVVTRVETVEHLGAPLHRAHIERDDREFALVPGGTVRLGFDLDSWKPSPEQLGDYADTLTQGWGFDPDLRSHLAKQLSPPRAVTLSSLLVAVEDERLTEAPADMPRVLASRGLRMPSPDEWEHACGAGATTLFRWGDDCPLDHVPYGSKTGPHLEPNAFGLHIAYDVYRGELSSDVSVIHGGDGGEAVCGGYGTLLAWLPLATANRNPSLAELAYGPDGDDLYDEFSVRPTITLA